MPTLQPPVSPVFASTVAIGSLPDRDATFPSLSRMTTRLVFARLEATVRAIRPSGAKAGADAMPSIETGQPARTPDGSIAVMALGRSGSEPKPASPGSTS